MREGFKIPPDMINFKANDPSAEKSRVTRETGPVSPAEAGVRTVIHTPSEGPLVNIRDTRLAGHPAFIGRERLPTGVVNTPFAATEGDAEALVSELSASQEGRHKLNENIAVVKEFDNLDHLLSSLTVKRNRLRKNADEVKAELNAPIVDSLKIHHLGAEQSELLEAIDSIKKEELGLAIEAAAKQIAVLRTEIEFLANIESDGDNKARLAEILDKYRLLGVAARYLDDLLTMNSFSNKLLVQKLTFELEHAAKLIELGNQILAGKGEWSVPAPNPQPKEPPPLELDLAKRLAAAKAGAPKHRKLPGTNDKPLARS